MGCSGCCVERTQAKNEAGLDHYQVRTCRAVCPHHLVHACPGLAGRNQSRCRKRGIGVSDHGMIGYTLPEIRRLLINLVQRYLPEPWHVWHWSDWRRRRQHLARFCHYRRRGHPLT
jgi:hypothetical protein